MDLSRIQIELNAEHSPTDIQNLISFAYLLPNRIKKRDPQENHNDIMRLHKSIHIKFIVIFRFSFCMMSVFGSYLSREQDFGFVSLFVDRKKNRFSFSS